MICRAAGPAIALLACTIFAAVSARAEEPASPLRRGDSGVNQQSEEGAWHSETYGSLRDGAAVTALSLYAISHLPAEMRMSHRPACERAYAWLEPGIERRGYLVNHDGSPNIPNYGSSMTLTAIRRL